MIRQWIGGKSRSVLVKRKLNDPGRGINRKVMQMKDSSGNGLKSINQNAMGNLESKKQAIRNKNLKSKGYSQSLDLLLLQDGSERRTADVMDVNGTRKEKEIPESEKLVNSPSELIMLFDANMDGNPLNESRTEKNIELLLETQVNVNPQSVPDILLNLPDIPIKPVKVKTMENEGRKTKFEKKKKNIEERDKEEETISENSQTVDMINEAENTSRTRNKIVTELLKMSEVHSNSALTGDQLFFELDNIPQTSSSQLGATHDQEQLSDYMHDYDKIIEIVANIPTKTIVNTVSVHESGDSIMVFKEKLRKRTEKQPNVALLNKATELLHNGSENCKGIKHDIITSIHSIDSSDKDVRNSGGVKKLLEKRRANAKAQALQMIAEDLISVEDQPEALNRLERLQELVRRI